MNAQDLKNSILQLAIQGKLVEQRKEEGNARGLLEQIKVEKEQLIKKGEIKKEKPLQAITTDEIPFNIPEDWEWVRLGEICSEITKGTTPRGGNVAYLDDGVGFLRAENVAGLDLLDLSNLKYINEDTHLNSLKRSVLQDNDVLITIAGTLGRTAIVKQEYLPLNTNQAVSIVRLVNSTRISLLYLVYSINAPAIQIALVGQKKITAIPNLTLQIISNCIVPIPPLEEQERIVAKIQELIPYVGKYGEAQSELKVFNNKFPEDLQKSILQYAIQGKLVEQREDEGTGEALYQQIQEQKAKLIKEGRIKKEKSLPAITEDEPPFDIPDNWKWVRLGDICEKIGSGSTPTGGKSVYKDSGIKFLRSQNIYNDGLRMDSVAYISEEQNKKGSTVKAKDILLNITGGSIGRCALVPDDFDVANINQHVMIIRNLVSDNRYFMHYILISPYIQSLIMSVQVGVSREGLSAEKLINFLIPLPPLEEQKRIVTKIEELMPFCQQLVK